MKNPMHPTPGALPKDRFLVTVKGVLLAAAVTEIDGDQVSSGQFSGMERSKSPRETSVFLEEKVDRATLR